jgi:signal peptidase I
MPRPPSDFAVLRAVAVPLVLALALVAAFDMVSIAGTSMEPTMASGDRVLVFRGAYGVRPWRGEDYLFRWREPGRGDIVLIENPIDGNPVVKRCIGLPGDRLIVAHRNIYVAGTAYPLDGDSTPSLEDYRRVPPGSFFVVGDNPGFSLDSRHYGPVSHHHLLGRVVR